MCVNFHSIQSYCDEVEEIIKKHVNLHISFFSFFNNKLYACNDIVQLIGISVVNYMMIDVERMKI